VISRLGCPPISDLVESQHCLSSAKPPSFPLRLNHAPVNQHLKRISKIDSARCPARGEDEETIAHFLLHSPSYRDAHERWAPMSPRAAGRKTAQACLGRSAPWDNRSSLYRWPTIPMPRGDSNRARTTTTNTNLKTTRLPR